MIIYTSWGYYKAEQFLQKMSATLNIFHQVSEAIIEEEDEQVNVDRNIDEIDEQM